MPIEQLTDELARAIPAAAFGQGYSGAVRVTVDRTPVFEDAYGDADRAHGIPNTVDTRFGVASGGKLFTALAVGTLIDEGRLTFDTLLRDVVSTPLPGVSPVITIRHLLTHTSGVYDYYDEELIHDFDSFELAIPPFKLLGPKDYLPLITGHPMKFEPGERFSYSNSGYVLLGLLIEDVADQPYHEAVARRVLRPCGMDASGFFRFDQLPDKVANGYVSTDAGWRTNIYLLPIVGGPDGGVFSTVGDIERAWSHLFDATLMSANQTDTYLTRAAEWKPGHYYGHGVWIHDDGDGPPRLYIEGSDAGISFRSTCYSEAAIATVMSNTSTGAWPMHAVIDEMMRRCLSTDVRGFSRSFEPRG